MLSMTEMSSSPFCSMFHALGNETVEHFPFREKACETRMKHFKNIIY